MPSEATHRVLIQMPIEEAWENLRNFTLAPNYVPNLTGCDLHPGPSEGMGASRRVFQKNGKFLDETVVRWEEGQGFVIRLHEGDKGAPAPFNNANFTYRLKRIGSTTELTTSMSYDLRGGTAGKLFDKLLMNRVFRKVVGQIAENLKEFYETGKPTNKTYKP
ncbi:MAG: SRPBCC family protein [Endozoicomonas sp.]